ncbi:hypothetical protein QBC34DRAFT_211031 [Podospora aff. communis PSN243]|uniref:Uncharacterized protein n=1 Tax=Podospora aff. communis PSN243 TaxID=3040156 RepID=A0AAV9G5Z7_9PEZI|nr:hypothetical protein QBC34DRAFT_211031 [Podospora aff. communis PSN243]
MTPITVALLATTSMFQVPPDGSRAMSPMSPASRLHAPAQRAAMAIVETPLRNHRVGLQEVSDTFGISSTAEAGAPSELQRRTRFRSTVPPSPGSDAVGPGQENTLAPTLATTLSDPGVMPHDSDTFSAPTVLDSEVGITFPLITTCHDSTNPGSSVTFGEEDLDSPSPSHARATGARDHASRRSPGPESPSMPISSTVGEVASLLLMAILLRQATNGLLEQGNQRCIAGSLKATTAPSQSTRGSQGSPLDSTCLSQDSQRPCRFSRLSCRLSTSTTKDGTSFDGMLNPFHRRLSSGYSSLIRPSRRLLTAY